MIDKAYRQNMVFQQIEQGEKNEKIVMLLVWTLCFLLLCGCGEKNELPETLGDAVGTEEEKQSGTEQENYEETSVTVGEKVFSVQEINTGIQRTL